MTADDQNPRPDVSHALDELLSQANWPQPEPARLERLHRYWSSVSSQRGQSRRWMMISAIAAALLLSFGLSWFAWTTAEAPPESPAPPTLTHSRPVEPDRQPVRPDIPPSPLKQPGEMVHAPDAPERIERADPIVVPDAEQRAHVSRPASAFETMAFLAIERRKQVLLTHVRAVEIQAAIQELLDNPAADAARVAEPLLADMSRHEQQLLRLLPGLDEPSQRAAITLLRHIGSRRSLPALVDLSQIPAHRAAAVRALFRLAEAETLAQIVADETDESLGREIYAALLGRRDSKSMTVYLEFVENSSTRDQALSAVNDVESLPIDLLFEFLASRRQTQRLAAALVLGRVDDPAVERRLIHIARNNVNRQEALLALLESPGAEAVRFLQSARRDLMLVSAVQSAEFQRRVMSN